MAQEAAWSAKVRVRDGAFRRKRSEFRDAITPGGRFAPEAGRYHLYVQWACPWAHRTLLARTLLGLEEAISVDVVDWRMQDDGSWVFNPDEPGCTADAENGAASLQDVYRAADPDFGGVGTVPVLWDRHEKTIVNNESREILRMFDTVLAPAVGDRSAWTRAGLAGEAVRSGNAAEVTAGAGADAADPSGPAGVDGEGAERPSGPLLPAGLADDVDAMIDANYEPVNNGVYKCGFATTQDAYDDAEQALFERLSALDAHLDGRDWLVGDGRGVLTEADVALWPTLLRFDPVYHTHFKCNRRRIKDLPDLWAFTKRFYRLPGVAETVDLRHIRQHYYWSHKALNPHRIVPPGPDMEGELAETGDA